MGWRNSSFNVYVKSRMFGTIMRASSILFCAIKSAVPCSVGFVFCILYTYLYVWYMVTLHQSRVYVSGSGCIDFVHISEKRTLLSHVCTAIHAYTELMYSTTA